MHSSTANLPKGQSYPLKPTALKAALSAAGIEIDTSLTRSPGDLFDAYFWPLNENVPYERLYVRAGSVPVAEAADARQRIERVTLPSLVEWIGEILAQDRKSPVRREIQSIRF
ncbi:MAG: hypothetical protein WC804_16295 [Sphingomonas sp.]|jgi:malonyl CoA-acyl carrier protein transacylase|uniref:hypothetical protein n=1 Tax=Sphingomonas sp. TaxID=28214 RepID=UPI0035698676